MIKLKISSEVAAQVLIKKLGINTSRVRFRTDSSAWCDVAMNPDGGGREPSCDLPVGHKGTHLEGPYWSWSKECYHLWGRNIPKEIVATALLLGAERVETK